MFINRTGTLLRGQILDLKEVKEASLTFQTRHIYGATCNLKAALLFKLNLPDAVKRPRPAMGPSKGSHDESVGWIQKVKKIPATDEQI